jgi:hypothetical protein
LLEENKAEGKLKLNKNQVDSAGGTSSQGRERRPRVSWKGGNPGLWGVREDRISGANKLFVAGGTKPVYETLVKAEVPFPRQMAYFVSGVEFVCGSLVTVGFLSSPACVALLIDMTVATLTSSLSTLPKGLSLLTGSTISSTFRKSCTCSSLSG